MEISDEAVGSDVHKITLSGRMDIEGVNSIDVRFVGMTAAPRLAIVVDMQAVSFMCSMGIRVLLQAAKAVTKRGGKIALLSPQREVVNVLAAAGVAQLITVCNDLDEALQRVSR
jgi:anti-sigma B factor antagonist